MERFRNLGIPPNRGSLPHASSLASEFNMPRQTETPIGNGGWSAWGEKVGRRPLRNSVWGQTKSTRPGGERWRSCVLEGVGGGTITQSLHGNFSPLGLSVCRRRAWILEFQSVLSLKEKEAAILGIGLVLEKCQKQQQWQQFFSPCSPAPLMHEVLFFAWLYARRKRE